MGTSAADEAMLRKGDLVPDRALKTHDRDEFGHKEIAARVADLLTTAEPPLNVALFGPWGSGKSSFATLLKSALSGRKLKTAFVRYDSWKYAHSGDALQRTFIADAAEQLKVADPYYSSQLAQTFEHTQIDLKQATWKQARSFLWWVWRMVVPLTAIGLALFVAGVAIVSAAAGRDISHELLHYLALFAIPVGGGLYVGLSKLITDSATSKSIEAPPTEEGFEERFTSLLKEASGSGGYERFVFFIDELDRVSPRYVVETLGVIKNFLDQENAVFVVAADKQVLERAFKRLPQATPANEDQPYYSSASEFLDKIFQHQVTLPPLRGSTLLRFAHDLVADRPDGVWQELKNAEAGGQTLDDVLYALIPSHVRSPRRVKVLLNAFATNARIAQSRGIDWVSRAPEIAKLTALQTEFPLLAAALDTEPSLPKLLLDSGGAVLSERRRRLLARFALDTSAPAAVPKASDESGKPTEVAAEDAAAKESAGSMAEGLPGATDRLLVESGEQPKLVSTQRENLRRYLQRTERVPNPTRELLFLEPGGAAEGLDDPELGELLEAETVDNPAAVVAAARERTPEEQQTIVRVLAGMSEQAYAEERANIITALLDVVRLLDGDLGSALGAASAAVNVFASTDTLHERHLTGALRVGIAAARATGDTALRDAVLDDDRLLEDANRVRVVADLLDDLPEPTREAVCAAVGDYLEETTDVLTEPLRLLSPAGADALLRDQSVRKAVISLLAGAAAADAETICSDLFDALDDRTEDAPDARLRLMRMLIDSESDTGYAAATEQGDAALKAAGTGQLANGVGLAALRIGPSRDWPHWLPWLDEAAAPFGAHKRLAELALIKVMGLLQEATEVELAVALELAPRIARVARLEDGDVSTALTTTVQTTLQRHPWWTDASLFENEAKMHEIVRTLASAIGEETATAFAAARHQDLIRALTSGGMTRPLFRAVSEWAVGLDAAQIRDLATRLAQAPVTADEAHNVDLLLARTHLWRQAWDLDEETDGVPYDIDTDQVSAAARMGSSRGQDLVIAWLEFEVSEETIYKIISGLDRAPTEREAAAFRTWLSSLSSADARTRFLTQFARDGGDALGWLRAAAASEKRDYSEQVIAHSIVSEAMQATRADERRACVDALLALDPREPEAQREVGRLIVWLLGLNKRGDFDTAVVAVGALGQEHAMGGRIAGAFRKASATLDKKLPHTARDTFAGVKINLGQSYFEQPPKKKSKWKSWLGG